MIKTGYLHLSLCYYIYKTVIKNAGYQVRAQTIKATKSKLVLHILTGKCIDAKKWYGSQWPLSALKKYFGGEQWADMVWVGILLLFL